MPAKAKSSVSSNTLSHPLGREIGALLLALSGVMLFLSLASYDARDLIPPAGGPGPEVFQNLLGRTGAGTAQALFWLLGLAAFWLPLMLLATAVRVFRSRGPGFPFVTFLAALFLLLSSAGILAHRFQAPLPFGHGHLSAGGVIGTQLSGWVPTYFNSLGTYLLLGAVWAVSGMVLTRVSLARLITFLARGAARLLRRAGTVLTKRRERRRRARKTRAARQKIKTPAPAVTIATQQVEKERPPEQELFPFMQADGAFGLPPLEILNDPPQRPDAQLHRESLEMNARLLVKKLADFGVEGEVTEISPGPVITMYEFKPAPGIKISRVAGLADDLAMALRAPSIRIVANLPGKAAIGIEIPNNLREVVYLKEILNSPAYRTTKYRLPIALGKDITGAPVITDLSRMPHLLVAGATGTGKSVSINTMINSLLFKFAPQVVRLLMIDPKRIELSIYQDIPHLLHPVVTQPKDATKALRWAVREMERRYVLLAEKGVRNIETYNRKLQKEPPAASRPRADGPEPEQPLPYIILIIDELADLMMVSSKEVESAITRLAQMARAAGIHLIVATQRPSVDVLTGLIKANFPARISFQVSSKVDSRTILDANGAETLLGDGDMLFLPPGVGRLTRIHGAFVSEEDVKIVTDFLRRQQAPDYDTTILQQVEEEADEADGFERDEKYAEAVELVCKSGQASISMLQRKLRVGYNRAARMIEAMELDGLVGPSDGVRPRQVYGPGN